MEETLTDNTLAECPPGGCNPDEAFRETTRAIMDSATGPNDLIATAAYLTGMGLLIYAFFMFLQHIQHRIDPEKFPAPRLKRGLKFLCAGLICFGLGMV